MEKIEFTKGEIGILAYITSVVRSMLENDTPKEVTEALDSIQSKLKKLNDEN